MSEEDLTQDSEGIKNLRKEFEALKKLNAERETELNKYRDAERSGNVAKILQAKGIDEARAVKTAKLYAGDPSEDAVGKWAEEFADVFGVSAPAGDVNDANAQAATRVSGASHGSSNSGAGARTESGAVLGDPAELARYIRATPMEQLVAEGLMPQPGTLFNLLRK